MLFGGAGAMDYVARSLRRPTRFAWLMAMVVALGLSTDALVRHTAPAAVRRVTADAGPSSCLEAVNGTTVGAPSVRVEPVAGGGRLQRALATTRSLARSTAGFFRRMDVTSLDAWNRPLVLAWSVSSVIVLSWFAGALVRLRRIERALPAG